MSDQTENPQSSFRFQFVNSTVNTPTAPTDLATRTFIRKHVMKKVSAARKQTGSYGKHNLRQYPIFVDNAVDPQSQSQPQPRTPTKLKPIREISTLEEQRFSQAYSTTGAGINARTTKQVTKEDEHKETNIIPKKANSPEELPTTSCPIQTLLPLQTPYELTTLCQNLNILCLTNLTAFHISRATQKALSSNPSQIINLLQYSRSQNQNQNQSQYQCQSPPDSILSYLPSLYEQSACVRYAADCVLARVRQVLCPDIPGWEAFVISRYVKALNVLQKALDSPKQRFSAEVLYAIEILAIYELLAPSGPTNWIRHSAGAARLIQLRGPKRYKTEFEKSLFMAHVGPISTESMLNNIPCFLDSPAWKQVFLSTIITPTPLNPSTNSPNSPRNNTITNRSPIVIKLLIHKSKIAGLFSSTTQKICTQTSNFNNNNNKNTPPSPNPFSAIQNRAQQLKKDLLNWRQENTNLLGPSNSSIPEINHWSEDAENQCKVIGIYQSCLLITNRLISSINSSQRSELEAENRGIVSEVFEMERRVMEARPEAALFFVQSIAVAKAILGTMDLWLDGSAEGLVGDRGDVVENHNRNGIIERWKFERLCDLMGRTFE